MRALQKKPPNPAVNRTPNSYAVGFPPLRSGAGYFQRYAPIMTRYFFAIFIALVAFSLNAAVFSGGLSGGSLILAAVSVNLFIFSLSCFWIAGYLKRFNQARFIVFGHAILFLAGGIGVFCLGYHSIKSKSCLFLVHDTPSRNLIDRLAHWAIENNYCPWLGAGLVAVGAFMAWPILKLLFGISTKGA